MKSFIKKNVIITGLSGAGISSALKAMEDLRFEVFDNFPLSFIPQLYSEKDGPVKNVNGIAIGVDTRTRGFSPETLLEVVEKTESQLVYITCDDTMLFKRFSETRRRHPLALDKSVSYGIRAEREMFALLQEKSDVVIDSTNTSIHDLRHILEGHFALKSDENLTVSLLSFGFKNGVPREANIVMDVRFLKNPHWDEHLKSMTGLDQKVANYIREDQDFDGFITNLKNLLKPLLPRYALEGKSYLSVAIGCTGGRHRSVFTVELLKKWLEENGVKVFAEHRDLSK